MLPSHSGNMRSMIVTEFQRFSIKSYCRITMLRSIYEQTRQNLARGPLVTNLTSLIQGRKRLLIIHMMITIFHVLHAKIAISTFCIVNLIFVVISVLVASSCICAVCVVCGLSSQSPFRLFYDPTSTTSTTGIVFNIKLTWGRSELNLYLSQQF